MFTLAAFADEISPDPAAQAENLIANGVRFVELRGAFEKNALDFTDAEVKKIRKIFREAGLNVFSIGSPIGKVEITHPFEEHLEKFRRALRLAEVFNASYVRIFSFYPPGMKAEGDWRKKHRAEVMRRLGAMRDEAVGRPVTLAHENETAIYGEMASHCADIMREVGSDKLKSVFDPANFAHCGEKCFEVAWPLLRGHTAYFHIKDYSREKNEVRPAGEGDGDIARILADARARGFSGFLSLEPHLQYAGASRGFTGPELFKHATDALKKVLDSIGAEYG